MNEVIQAIKGRRSIRKFKPDMPAKEELEQIIEAGLYAASGMGKQAAHTVGPERIGLLCVRSGYCSVFVIRTAIITRI